MIDPDLTLFLLLPPQPSLPPPSLPTRLVIGRMIRLGQAADTSTLHLERPRRIFIHVAHMDRIALAEKLPAHTFLHRGIMRTNIDDIPAWKQDSRGTCIDGIILSPRLAI